MPHRHQPIVPLCYECKTAAADHCLRCGAPVCGDHAPIDDDHRCASCEAGYLEKNEWLQRAADGAIHAPIGRVTVGYLSTLFLLGCLPPIVIWGGLPAYVGFAVLTFLCVRWYRKTPPRRLAARAKLRRNRKRFLRKRTAKALPSKPAQPRLTP